MATSFIAGNGSITLDSAPVSPRQTTIRKAQPHDWSRGGVFYLYDRGITIVDHRLLFSRQPLDVVDQVFDFFDNHVRGSMTPFIWREGETDHLAMLSGSIKTREQYPGYHSLALSLIEIVQPGIGLLDTFDQTLLDSDGNIILGL